MNRQRFRESGATSGYAADQASGSERNGRARFAQVTAGRGHGADEYEAKEARKRLAGIPRQGLSSEQFPAQHSRPVAQSYNLQRHQGEFGSPWKEDQSCKHWS